MSDQPHPQLDALRKMQEVFTTEQIHIIAEHARRLQQEGYGTLTIEFDNGTPDLVGWTITRKLPRRTE